MGAPLCCGARASHEVAFLVAEHSLVLGLQ